MFWELDVLALANHSIRVYLRFRFSYHVSNSTGDHAMPYVNIKITKEGATKEQKQLLIAGATQLLVDVLGKNPATTVVTIDEVDTDNWGIGGSR